MLFTFSDAQANGDDDRSSEEDIDKLKAVLAKLENRLPEPNSSPIATSSPLADSKLENESSSALDSLYKKLKDLDVDLHELLDGSSDLEKRQRSGNFRNGNYPKEFMPQ